MPPDAIAVRGARENNLQGVDVDLPRGRLVVVTGASGGGKSSLLMGTVFAEGRRRFLATLPAAARAAAGPLRRPKVDRVAGLPPVVAVSQAMTRAARRSTVATLTELADSLALLFARAGTAHCVDCGRALQAQTIDQIAGRLLALPERTKLILLAPMRDAADAGDATDATDAAETLARIQAEGFVRVRIDGALHETDEAPPVSESSRIEAVVDRLVVKPGIEERLRESLDLAVEQGQGRCVVTEIVPGGDRAGNDVAHSVRFACPDCGVSYPDPEPRLFRFQSPYGACPRCRGYGLIEDDDGRESTCPACDGARLQPMARAVTLGEANLPDVLTRCPSDVAAWAGSLASDDPIAAAAIALVVPEVVSRCGTLDRLGLGYLSLDRRGRTLSGGELQRTRLVAALGSGLTRVAYLLDEPTAGLHPADTDRLLDSLRTLRDAGNTVAVIEHDESVIGAADWIIEIGPSGGRDGGQLVYAGQPRVTEGSVEPPPAPDSPTDGPMLSLRGVRVRTLDAIDVAIPVGQLTGLCGLSGSGKSTLLHDAIAPAVRTVLEDELVDPAICASATVPDEIVEVLLVTQDAAGRSPRSTPATLLGLWGLVRKVFARTRIARLRGYDAARFSFNAADGTCPQCRGRGTVRLRSTLLADETQTCPQCDGRRFDEATLEVTFKGLTLADVLGLTMSEAADVFDQIERLAHPLRWAERFGLGSLTLGQPADTLSGGERQRLRLLRTLVRGGQYEGGTLFLLDEPTAGLHRGEVDRLIALLRELTAAGHTLVVIEHHPRLLAACDRLIELGPGAGPDGGRIIFTGTPRELAVADTPTGRAMR